MNEQEISKLAKEVSNECIAYRVRLLNRVITGIYDRALKPLDIKINQANILTMLSLTDYASSADIAKMLIMEKSTVRRVVNRMRQKGWVRIAAHGNGPSQEVSITPEGTKLLAAVYVQWEKAQQQATDLLGEDGVAMVRKLHDTIRPS
jgi:DNA-binding MarR family transcriptional regulator